MKIKEIFKNHTLEREIYFAFETILKGCSLTIDVQKNTIIPSLQKSDRSPVTIADFGVQAIVGHDLDQVFPTDPLVAEESSELLQQPKSGTTLEQVTQYVKKIIPTATSSQVCNWIDKGIALPDRRFWTLDPIDGTKGFLRQSQYALALALIIDGQIQIGILGCPSLCNLKDPSQTGLGCIVIAAKNGGSWLAWLDNPHEFHKISVSECNDIHQARVLRSYESQHTNPIKVATIIQSLEIKAPAIHMDSQAKYTVLASGNAELLFRLCPNDQPHRHEHIWDHAAGIIILEEAGGKSSDTLGKSLDFSCGAKLSKNQGILASNKFLYSSSLKAVLEVAKS